MDIFKKIKHSFLIFLKKGTDFKKFPRSQEEKRKVIKNVYFLLTPLISTPIFYFIFYFINSRYFNFTLFDVWHKKIYLIEWFWIDLIIQILIAYFFISISKRISLFLPTQFLFMGIFYTGNAIKNSFFGFPITVYEIYDFHTIKGLFEVLKGVFLFYLLSVVITFVVLILLNFKLRKSFLIFLVFFTVFFALIRNNSETILNKFNYLNEPWWEKALMFKKYGASGYFIFENAHYFFVYPKVPSKEEVKEAVDSLKEESKTKKYLKEINNFIGKKRNVYLIVLESFWDPSLLKNAHFSRDPLYEEFREKWREAGYSKSLSPSFAGDTSSAEYEILCGYPKILGGIYFDVYIKNNIPCLPSILKRMGYTTFAFHPDIPDFWNRRNTYPKIGFDKFFSKKDFVFDDLNGVLLSDESLYLQSMAKVKQEAPNSPKFVYILTYTGHWPYELNPQKRPKIIKSESKVNGVEEYANSIYYSSKELVEFIDEILKNDPDALIIALGDHPPNLGKNFAGYVESNLTTSSYEKFTPNMLFIRSAVPILIIDGKRGAQNIGIVNHYDLPRIILSFLNVKIPDYLEIIPPKENFITRVLENSKVLVIKPDYSLELCDPEKKNGTCSKVEEWLNNIKILTNDIILGQQYSLRYLK